LKEKGMLEQADDFTLASGRLSALCYKAEMEMALRTPGFGGFQLLDLQDFPGQGVATIGVLNAFMESKGVTTPEEWTNSCSASTLLARFPGYVWTADQHFKAAVELAHYGKGNLTDATVRWALRDSQGGVVASGTLGSVDVPQGTLAPLGTVEFGFAQLKEVPARLNLELGLVGTSITNEYPLWVYPSKVESQPQPMVRSSLDEAAIKELKRGGAVILLRSGASPGSTAMMFTPDFWAYDLFKRENPPGTMGLLMDPEHPALAKFPTEYHSNWQWFDISNASWPMILDEMPAGYRPIVQVIDNFTRCHRLGLVSEFKCDGGRLLVVSCDLEKLASNAAARQLMTSLVSYVQSEAFNPQYELPPTLRDGLAITNLALGKPAKATGSREGDDNSPSRAVDGDESTFWLAPDAKPGYSWQVDLGVAANVEQCELTFETAEKYSYVLEGSPDGAQWFPLADTTKDENNQARHAYQIQQKGLRYLRVTFHDTPRWWGSLREFKAFGTPASSE